MSSNPLKKNKHLREADVLLREEGWALLGYDAQGKLIYQHPKTPRWVRLDPHHASPRNASNWVSGVRQLSRKNLAFGEAQVDRFYLHLCKKYEVQEKGCRRIVTRIIDEVREFAELEPSVNAASLAVNFASNRKDVLVMVKRGSGKTLSHYDLRGVHYGEVISSSLPNTPPSKEVEQHEEAMADVKPSPAEETKPAEPEESPPKAHTNNGSIPAVSVGTDPDLRDLLRVLGSVIHPQMQARTETAMDALLRVRESLKADLLEVEAAIDILNQPIGM